MTSLTHPSACICQANVKEKHSLTVVQSHGPHATTARKCMLHSERKAQTHAWDTDIQHPLIFTWSALAIQSPSVHHSQHHGERLGKKNLGASEREIKEGRQAWPLLLSCRISGRPARPSRVPPGHEPLKVQKETSPRRALMGALGPRGQEQAAANPHETNSDS